MEVDPFYYSNSYCSNEQDINIYDSDTEDRDVSMKELISIPADISRKEVMTMLYTKYVRDDLMSANLKRFKNLSYVVTVDFLNYYYDQRMGNSVIMKSDKISRFLAKMLEELHDNKIWVEKVIFVVDWGRNEVKGTNSYDTNSLTCLQRVICNLGLPSDKVSYPESFDITRHNVVLTSGYDGEDLMVYLTKRVNSIYVTNDNDILVIHSLLDNRKKLFYRNNRFQVVNNRHTIRQQLHACLDNNPISCREVLRCSNISSHYKN